MSNTIQKCTLVFVLCLMGFVMLSKIQKKGIPLPTPIIDMSNALKNVRSGFDELIP